MLKKSIFLIGMPGCGKTTIGRLLAKQTSCRFFDMDDTVVELTGKTVQELFSLGETVFRDAETAACHKLTKRAPGVIACGGGVVKRAENIEILRQNGVIIFVDRPVAHIASDIDMLSRPLLKEGVQKLYALYRERYALYQQYADICIDNTGTAEQAAAALLNNLNKKEMFA